MLHPDFADRVEQFESCVENLRRVLLTDDVPAIRVVGVQIKLTVLKEDGDEKELHVLVGGAGMIAMSESEIELMRQNATGTVQDLRTGEEEPMGRPIDAAFPPSKYLENGDPNDHEKAAAFLEGVDAQLKQIFAGDTSDKPIIDTKEGE